MPDWLSSSSRWVTVSENDGFERSCGCSEDKKRSARDSDRGRFFARSVSWRALRVRERRSKEEKLTREAPGTSWRVRLLMSRSPDRCARERRGWRRGRPRLSRSERRRQGCGCSCSTCRRGCRIIRVIGGGVVGPDGEMERSGRGSTFRRAL